MGNIKFVVYLCVISLLHPVLCVRMHTPPSHVLCALGPFPSLPPPPWSVPPTTTTSFPSLGGGGGFSALNKLRQAILRTA